MSETKKYLKDKKKRTRKLSDFLWLFAALLCICSVIFVYFQIVQPNILTAYADIAKTNAVDMQLDIEKKYNQYITETSNSIPEEILSASSDICSTYQYYEGFGETKVNLAQLENKLQPSPEFDTLPNVYIFSDEAINIQNRTNYTEYIEAIQFLETQKSDLIEALSFLDFRNEWIDACEEIQDRTFVSINNSCAKIVRNSKNYLEGGNPTGRMEIGDLVDRCDEALEDNFIFTNQWMFDFLKDFDSLMSVDISTISIDQKESILQNYNQIQDSFQNRSSEINLAVSDKKKFQNIWYLLETNF